MRRFWLVATALAIFLGFTVELALADWDVDDPHKMHFPQLPDYDGMDIYFRYPSVLADDWRCSETGEVTDIHFWFSAQYDWFDVHEDWGNQIAPIHLWICSNIPWYESPTGYSMPGDTLWRASLYPDTVTVFIREYGEGNQAWYDPNTGEYIPLDHTKIYQCNIYVQDPIVQWQDSIYWLAISIDSNQPLGWKTADRDMYPDPHTGRHFEDRAVWGPDWQTLGYPPEAYPDTGGIDLAFVIGNRQAGVRGDLDTGQTSHGLSQANPNPFQSEATFWYDAPTTGHTSISVHTVRGQRVRTLVDSDVPKGRHTVVWDGRDDFAQRVAPGVYFIQLKSGDSVVFGKTVLLR